MSDHTVYTPDSFDDTLRDACEEFINAVSRADGRADRIARLSVISARHRLQRLFTRQRPESSRDNDLSSGT